MSKQIWKWLKNIMPSQNEKIHKIYVFWNIDNIFISLIYFFVIAFSKQFEIFHFLKWYHIVFVFMILNLIVDPNNFEPVYIFFFTSLKFFFKQIYRVYDDWYIQITY